MFSKGISHFSLELFIYFNFIVNTSVDVTRVNILGKLMLQKIYNEGLFLAIVRAHLTNFLRYFALQFFYQTRVGRDIFNRSAFLKKQSNT